MRDGLLPTESCAISQRAVEVRDLYSTVDRLLQSQGNNEVTIPRWVSRLEMEKLEKATPNFRFRYVRNTNFVSSPLKVNASNANIHLRCLAERKLCAHKGISRGFCFHACIENELLISPAIDVT